MKWWYVIVAVVGALTVVVCAQLYLARFSRTYHFTYYNKGLTFQGTYSSDIDGKLCIHQIAIILIEPNIDVRNEAAEKYRIMVEGEEFDVRNIFETYFKTHNAELVLENSAESRWVVSPVPRSSDVVMESHISNGKVRIIRIKAPCREINRRPSIVLLLGGNDRLSVPITYEEMVDVLGPPDSSSHNRSFP